MPGGDKGAGMLGGKETAPGTGQRPTSPPVKKNTHFYGSVKIDVNKLGATAGTINTEVLQHLNKLAGVQIDITLERSRWCT
jgi:hypothetical protein